MALDFVAAEAESKTSLQNVSGIIKLMCAGRALVCGP